MALLLPAGASGAASARGAAKLDLRLEATPAIVEQEYRRLPPIGPNGEMGANLNGGRFSLAHQQLGDVYVRAGLVRGEPALIEEGFRAFDYAFSKQQRGGSFPAEQAEEYAFFVEAVAHSVLLLRATPYATTYAERLDEYARRAKRAARHMIAPGAWSEFEGRNASYTHSGYVVGTALILAGKLAHGPALTDHGRRAVRLAISRQRKSGVNPELGGYDVRYHMAGLVYAERFRVYFAGGRLKRRVGRMTNRGLEWMSRKIDADGWIDWTRSTRACRELNSSGKPKTPGYWHAIRGFAYWGARTGRDSLLAEAAGMRQYLENLPSGSSLCGPKA